VLLPCRMPNICIEVSEIESTKALKIDPQCIIFANVSVNVIVLKYL